MADVWWKEKDSDGTTQIENTAICWIRMCPLQSAQTTYIETGVLPLAHNRARLALIDVCEDLFPDQGLPFGEWRETLLNPDSSAAYIRLPVTVNKYVAFACCTIIRFSNEGYRMSEFFSEKVSSYRDIPSIALLTMCMNPSLNLDCTHGGHNLYATAAYHHFYIQKDFPIKKWVNSDHFSKETNPISTALSFPGGLNDRFASYVKGVNSMSTIFKKEHFTDWDTIVDVYRKGILPDAL